MFPEGNLTGQLALLDEHLQEVSARQNCVSFVLQPGGASFRVTSRPHHSVLTSKGASYFGLFDEGKLMFAWFIPGWLLEEDEFDFAE